MKNSNIGIRLFAGFGVIIFLTVFLGVVAIVYINTLADINKKMYDHPFRVSNAVREIQSNINGMHRSMKDVVLSANQNELNNAVFIVAEYEKNTFELFNLVFKYFLGNPKDVRNAYLSFSDWKTIRKDVIELMRSGSIEKAAGITKGEGAAHVARMNQNVQIMVDYATQKAAGFHTNAQQTKKRLLFIMSALLLVTIIIGIVISLIITRSITVPIKSLTVFASEMAKGANLPYEREASNDEIGQLVKSFNNIISSNNNFIIQAQAISEGDYSKDIQLRSENDELGLVFTKMTKTLRDAFFENKRQNLIKTGQNQLNEKMRGDLDITGLSQNIVTFLAEHFSAPVGALYIYDSEAEKLSLKGSYAFTKQIKMGTDFKIKEGLVGQVAYEQKPIIITEVPDDYIQIASGLCDAVPKSILVYPLMLMKTTKGVIELGSLQTFNDQDIEFLDIVAESIAIALNAAETRQHTKALLAQTQKQAEDLRS